MLQITHYIININNFINRSSSIIKCIKLNQYYNRFMRLINYSGYNLKDQAYFGQFQNKAFPSHKKNSTLSWNLQGNALATGQNTVRLWAFHQNLGLQLIAQSRVNDSTSINQLQFYQQNLILSITRDSLKIWDTRQMVRAVKSQKKSKPDILSFAWNNDSAAPLLTLLSKDNTVGIYDLRALSNLNEPLQSQKNKNDITEILWDKSGSVLFCAGGDSSSSILMMYNSRLQLFNEVLSLHNSKINSLAIDPKNQYLATCSDDSLLGINTLPDIICCRAYSHTDCSMKKVAFSSKSDYIAVSCQEPKMQIMKGEESKVTFQQPCIDFYNVKDGGHAYRIKCGSTPQTLQWHPKKTIIAYFDFDQEDRKRPGNQKQERYLHIFGL